MKKKRGSTIPFRRNGLHEIIGLLTASLGLFIGLSIYSRGKSAGVIGSLVYPFIKGLFGIVSYILPVLIVSIGILVIISKKKIINRSKIYLSLLSVYLFLCFIHLLFFRQFDPNHFTSFVVDSYKRGSEEVSKGTGAICAPAVYLIYSLFGLPGAYIFYITATLVCLLLLTNLSLKQLVIQFSRNIKINKFIKKFSNYRIKKKQEKEKINPKDYEVNNIQNEENGIPNHTINMLPSSKDELSMSESKDSDFHRLHVAVTDFDNFTLQDSKKSDVNVQITQKENDEGYDRLNVKLQQQSLPYMIPPVTLLKEPDLKKSNYAAEKTVRNNAKILEETLNSFGVSAKVKHISRGPVITRYELQPAPGVKVSRIVSLTDDIALNLAAPGVRVEAPIPGKAAIGVEVPNKDIAPVLLREVLETDTFFNHPSKIAFALGKDIAGNNIIADIAKMPHLLIAGATGSGKSVCINTLIVSILYKASPEEVRLIMIDPKVVELSSYNGIPHLMIPVVTDPRKAAGALNWAVQEMTNRYKLFAEKGVKDLERYNEQMKEEENDNKLPQIIVIIDELADLMMVAPGDVEDAIARLAQMARAAGIHLVIATQRPSVDVITGVIKANIPSRIAFSVSSQTDSRTILDIGGAEKLLGKGDMLYYPSGFSKPKRVQGAYISEKEVEMIVACIKNQNGGPQYNIEVLEETASDKSQDEDNFDDELLPEAIEIVINAGQASISMLQRRLRIGYARAARLIDEMELRGLVSGFDGSKPRNVLITKEEFEEQFKNI
ncbi:MAG: DNA translocase FtsK [Caldicoprobacterales bacterium]|jgi:S-DNA-T family DNA segregation ATPase FtsK/SpoIIIE